MAKVSICVPVYNNLVCVKRLMASTACQDYTDFELIMTDDSTNNEIEAYISDIRAGKEAAHFDKIKDKIKYQHNEKPLGHIFNWNEALSLAGGEYIKIMFSDDWFAAPDSLRKMVGMLEEKKEASFAFCGTGQVRTRGEEEKLIRRRSASPEFIEAFSRDYRHLFLGNEIGAPSATIYRSKADGSFSFDEKSGWASDMFLYFDILEKNPAFAWSKEALINIGEHEGQYTNLFDGKDEGKYRDYHYMYEKYGLSANEDCKQYFLREFLIPYKKGSKEAAACGVTPESYRRERRSYLRKVWKIYWNAGIRKIGKLAKWAGSGR